MEDNKETLEAQEVDKEDEAQVADENVVEVEDDATNSNDSGNQEEVDESKESSKEEESQDDDDSEEDNEFTNALKKVRNEAKNLRKRLREAEATIEQLRSESNDALVSERDALKKELDDLKLQVRNDKIAGQVKEEAAKLGAIEPEVVAKLIDFAKIELDEEGKPTNLTEQITQLRSQYKRMFTGVAGNGNIGNRNERGSQYEGMTAEDKIKSAFKFNDE